MGNCISLCCCSIKAAVFPELEHTLTTPCKQEIRQEKEVEITTVRVINMYQIHHIEPDELDDESSLESSSPSNNFINFFIS